MTFNYTAVINVEEMEKWVIEKARLEVSQRAMAIKTKAAATAPVDTGALKNSLIPERVNADMWTVSDGVDYGVYQELGTKHIPAKRFLTQACEREADTFTKNLINILKGDGSEPYRTEFRAVF